MIRSGRFSLALCVLTLGLQGCGTGTEADVPAGVEGEEGMGAASDSARDDMSAQSDSLAGAERERERRGNERNGDEGDDEDDATMGSDPADEQKMPEIDQECACGTGLLPGLDITEDNGEITITVDVPGAAGVALRLNSGDCIGSEQGLALSGDVNVDLGGLVTVPLLDVDLAVGPTQGASGVAISGSAGVAASLLGDLLLPIGVEDLRADVMLALGTSDLAQLDLALALPALRLDTSCLPLADAALELADTSVVVSTTSEHQLIGVQGNLGVGAAVPWLSEVPLSLGADVEVSALIADQELSSLKLDGDLQLDGGSLLCGITRLLPIAMPGASVSWDASGLEVHATTSTSPYPMATLLGDVDLTAAFGTSGWGIRMCGDGSLLGLTQLQLFECLDLSTSGIKVTR